MDGTSDFGEVSFPYVIVDVIRFRGVIAGFRAYNDGPQSLLLRAAACDAAFVN